MQTMQRASQDIRDSIIGSASVKTSSMHSQTFDLMRFGPNNCERNQPAIGPGVVVTRYKKNSDRLKSKARNEQQSFQDPCTNLSLDDMFTQKDWENQGRSSIDSYIVRVQDFASRVRQLAEG
jgi:hypothetical protein